MVAPVSVTLLADLSAQPADSSVEPTVGEVVTAAAVPLEPIPITRTSVRLTSRIARIRCSGMGGSLLAAVNDMRGLLLGLLPSCQHGVRAGPSTGRFDRGDEGGIASEVPRRWRSSAILRSKRASAVGVVDPATGRSQFEGPQGLTGGCTVPPMTCAGLDRHAAGGNLALQEIQQRGELARGDGIGAALLAETVEDELHPATAVGLGVLH